MLWTRETTTRLVPALIAGATILATAPSPARAYQEDVLFLGHTAVDPSEFASATPEGLLVRRDNGTPYLLTVGEGCQSLAEGRRITLRDDERPGSARGVVEDASSSISCPLFECRAVNLIEEDEAGSPESSMGLDPTTTDITHVVTALQRALVILGYGPGDVDGAVGPATAGALMQYRIDKQHDTSGKDLRFTLWTLGMDVLVAMPRDAGALEIAETLLGVSEQ